MRMSIIREEFGLICIEWVDQKLVIGVVGWVFF